MKIFGFLDVTRQSRLWKDPPKIGVTRVIYLFTMSFSRLVSLNMLFILLALPIITLPASFAALTKISMKIAKEEPIFLFTEFFETFKLEFKRASIFFWIHFGAILMTFFAIYYYLQQGNNLWFTGVPLVISILFAIMLFTVGFYAYPMLVTLNLSLIVVAKNALLLALLCWKQTLLLLLMIILVIFLIFLLLPFSVFIIVLLLFSCISFIVCYNVKKPLSKYVTKLDKEKVF